jgi:FkbM family methyltransferase
LSLASLIEARVLLLGSYEPFEGWLIDQFVRKGDVAIDAGANVGLHTLRMALNATAEGTVYAVEPCPEVRARLEFNMKLNRMKNVHVLPQALSDSPGNSTLYINPPKFPNRNATLVPDPTPEAIPVETPIRTVLLDELWVEVMQGANVSFFKLDVEGYELKVLRGAQRLVQSCLPVVMLEYNRHYAHLLGYSMSDVADYFARWPQYQIYRLGRYRLEKLPTEALDSLTTIVAIPKNRDSSKAES